MLSSPSIRLASILKSDTMVLVRKQGSSHLYSLLLGRWIALTAWGKKSDTSENYKDTYIPLIQQFYFFEMTSYENKFFFFFFFGVHASIPYSGKSNKTECSLVGRWLNFLYCIQIMEYYAAIKNNWCRIYELDINICSWWISEWENQGEE